MSANRWPRCSVCRPLRPPDCIQRSAGRSSVARAKMPSMVAFQVWRSDVGGATMPALPAVSVNSSPV